MTNLTNNQNKSSKKEKSSPWKPFNKRWKIFKKDPLRPLISIKLKSLHKTKKTFKLPSVVKALIWMDLEKGIELNIKSPNVSITLSNIYDLKHLM